MTVERPEPNWKTLSIGQLNVRYYLREPSPDLWNAVAVVPHEDLTEGAWTTCPLFVGVGNTPENAIQSLMREIMDRQDPVTRKLVNAATPRGTANYAASNSSPISPAF